MARIAPADAAFVLGSVARNVAMTASRLHGVYETPPPRRLRRIAGARLGTEPGRLVAALEKKRGGVAVRGWRSYEYAAYRHKRGL